jgi:hypothetical protein
MDPITNEAPGFQQTQNTRVTDPGPAQNANPPPPPKAVLIPVDINAPIDALSPHPFRGHNLNTSA